MVKQGSHIAGKTVDVRGGGRRRGRFPPTGERGADAVDVLGRDGTGDLGGLSDREGAMEIQENGRAGRVPRSGIGQRATAWQRELALVGGVDHGIERVCRFANWVLGI